MRRIPCASVEEKKILTYLDRSISSAKSSTTIQAVLVSLALLTSSGLISQPTRGRRERGGQPAESDPRRSRALSRCQPTACSPTTCSPRINLLNADDRRSSRGSPVHAYDQDARLELLADFSLPARSKQHHSYVKESPGQRSGSPNSPAHFGDEKQPWLTAPCNRRSSRRNGFTSATHS